MTIASLQLTDSKAPPAKPVDYPVMMQEMVTPPRHSPAYKSKVFLGVFFGLTAILSVTIILCVYFLRPVDTAPQIYLFTIDNDQQKIPMEVKMDKQYQVEYITTPVLGNSSNTIFILRDYEKGVTAHKDPEKALCYVGKLEISIDDRIRSLEKGGDEELNGTKKYTVLNETINPKVLSFTVGDKIASFCAPYDSRWMIPDNSDDNSDEDGDQELEAVEMEWVDAPTTNGPRVKRQWGGGWGGNRWGGGWGGNRWGGGWGGNRWGGGGWGGGGGRWRGGGGWGGGRWNRGCDYRCYSVCLLGCYRSCNRVC